MSYCCYLALVTTDILEYSETLSLTRKHKLPCRERSPGSEDGDNAINLILQQHARRRAATTGPESAVI